MADINKLLAAANAGRNKAERERDEALAELAKTKNKNKQICDACRFYNGDDIDPKLGSCYFGGEKREAIRTGACEHWKAASF